MEDLALVDKALSIIAERLYTDEIRERDEYIRELESKNAKHIKIISRKQNNWDMVDICGRCDDASCQNNRVLFCEMCENFYHENCVKFRDYCDNCGKCGCMHFNYCNSCGEYEYRIPCSDDVHIYAECTRLEGIATCEKCKIFPKKVCANCSHKVRPMN